MRNSDQKLKSYLNSTTENIKKLWNKIPENSKPVIIIIVGVLLMAGILLSDKIFCNNSGDEYVVSESERSDYCEIIEEKLNQLISSIDGAGRCKVMVTLEAGEENIFAKNINDSKSEYVVIKTSSDEGGLLLKIVQPKIRGVAVVCDGGEKFTVKNDITNAVCAVLGISSTRVSISKMNSQEANYG